MAGLRVGRPVAVLPHWGVITVASHWPLGTQPPLAMRALNIITSCLNFFVCVVLGALLARRGVAWRSSSAAFLLVPLLPSTFLVYGLPLRPGFSFFLFFSFVFFFVSGVCSFYFHWASSLNVIGVTVGGELGARGLVAEFWVGRPVGVRPPWGVIAVAAPWPLGTQPPLAMPALKNFIKCVQ